MAQPVSIGFSAGVMVGDFDRFLLRTIAAFGPCVDTVRVAWIGRDALRPAALRTSETKAHFAASPFASKIRVMDEVFADRSMAFGKIVKEARADGDSILLTPEVDEVFEPCALARNLESIRANPGRRSFWAPRRSFWRCLDNLMTDGTRGVSNGTSLFAVNTATCADAVIPSTPSGDDLLLDGLCLDLCYASLDDSAYQSVVRMAYADVGGVSLSGGKDFREDFFKLYKRFRERSPFAFSRYGDGEMAIIKGDSIDLSAKGPGEFKFNPADGEDVFFRDALLASMRFRHPDYFVGISPPAGVGEANWRLLKETSGQDDEHLTWATLFVNANYPMFLEYFVKEFARRQVVLVCNRQADPARLPFKVVKVFTVGANAWRADYPLVEEMKSWMRDGAVEGGVLLFAAGPFGDILAHQLFEAFPRNTYLNIGSTLDPQLGLGASRGYLRGGPPLNEITRWG